MELFSVDSSMMTHLGYKDGVLGVVFTGGAQYEYQNVPLKLWELLLSIARTDKAVSLGSAFHWTIRAHPNKYPFAKASNPTKVGLTTAASVLEYGG